MNCNRKLNTLFGSILIFAIVAIIHCGNTDWEYEYYYYVRIGGVSDSPYDIRVPLPSLSTMKNDSKTQRKYLECFTDGLMIEEGECAYNLVQYDENQYLQIKGRMPTVVSSSFRTWDIYLSTSIAKNGNNSTLMYSNDSGVSVVVEFRAVKKTGELKTWNLFYSAVSHDSRYLPFLTKETWRLHLSEKHHVSLKEGWSSYPVSSGKTTIR